MTPFHINVDFFFTFMCLQYLSIISTSLLYFLSIYANYVAIPLMYCNLLSASEWRICKEWCVYLTKTDK